jgi:hypothetical protein
MNVKIMVEKSLINPSKIGRILIFWKQRDQLELRI